MTDLYRLTAHEAHDLMKRREISSYELTQSCLERVEAVEERVKAFVTITGVTALEHARRADQGLASAGSTPLAGVPMQIKDVMCTKGIRTTCSSRMLKDFVPTYDATVVERLYSPGCRVAGERQHGRVRHGAPPPRTPPSSPAGTPGTWTGSQAAAAEVGRRRWRRGRPFTHWVPTQEEASASRPLFAASSASNPPTAW